MLLKRRAACSSKCSKIALEIFQTTRFQICAIVAEMYTFGILYFSLEILVRCGNVLIILFFLFPVPMAHVGMTMAQMVTHAISRYVRFPKINK